MFAFCGEPGRDMSHALDLSTAWDSLHYPAYEVIRDVDQMLARLLLPISL